VNYPFDIIINTLNHPLSQKKIEIVERKGIGHPDSLTEQIAEFTCRNICNYYKNKYKAIYRFNVDQVEINGGEIKIDFGRSQIIKPAEVIISGKASCVSQEECKKLNKIAIVSTKKLLTSIFNNKILRVFKIKSNIGMYSVRNKRFFESKNLPISEDTAIGIGFYPYTLAENLTLDIERDLSQKLIKEFPIGKDTKVMVVKKDNKGKIQIVISIAFLGEKIKNINEYFLLKEKIKEKLLVLVRKKINQQVEIVINAADNKKERKVYLTLTGTAAEHDKGSVGRGNKVSGLITPYRATSPEVIYGKNPVYNVGKLYNLLAFYLAQKIAKRFNNRLLMEVSILSQLGNPINIPQIINVNVSNKVNEEDKKIIRSIIFKEFKNLFRVMPNSNYTKFTDMILNNKLELLEIHHG